MNDHSNDNGNPFDAMMLSMGKQLALAAVQHAAEADNNWNRVKTMLSVIPKERKEDAVSQLFQPGKENPHRKAPWYRKQKRILRQALEYGIDFDGLSMRETELAIAATRSARRTRKEAEADALRMMQRTFKGAMERTSDAKVLSAIEQLMPNVAKTKRPASKPKRTVSTRR